MTVCTNCDYDIYLESSRAHDRLDLSHDAFHRAVEELDRLNRQIDVWERAHTQRCDVWPFCDHEPAQLRRSLDLEKLLRV